jgi:uncharacterized protein (TIGR02246 family)
MKKLVVVLAVCCLGAGVVLAEEPVSHEKDRQMILKLAEAYTAAFNRGDAKAVAAFFAEDGEIVGDDGQVTQGRAAIHEQLEASFATNAGARLVVTVDSIRFIKPEVAIERGTAIVASTKGPASTGNYTIVHAKNGSRWYIVSLQEDVQPPPPSHYNELADLEWMIGNWQREDDETAIRIHCDWTKNKNFITRSFSASIKDRIDIEGTQVIGWDAAEGIVRCWLFDSDGGFGEGVWTKNGDQWIVKLKGTRHDGSRASMINIITQIDNDSFAFETISRQVDGEILPNIDRVVISRERN